MLCRISGCRFNQEDPPSFFFPFKNYLYSISLQIHKHRKASTMRGDTQTHFMTSE